MEKHSAILLALNGYSFWHGQMYLRVIFCPYYIKINLKSKVSLFTFLTPIPDLFVSSLSVHAIVQIFLPLYSINQML